MCPHPNPLPRGEGIGGEHFHLAERDGYTDQLVALVPLKCRAYRSCMKSCPSPSEFLTIVGLFGLYKSDPAGRERPEHAVLDDFLDWLRRHDHGLVAEVIGEHPTLAKSLQGLIAAPHEAMVTQLRRLDKAVASVAAHVDGFEAVSTAVRIDGQLSDQSVSLLRQMNELAASAFIEYPLFGRAAPRYVMFGGMGGDLKVTDVRFIEHDIETMCQLGLLTEESFGQHRGFRITRAGAAIGAERDGHRGAAEDGNAGTGNGAVHEAESAAR